MSYVEPDDVEIMIAKDNAVIRNGKISCVFSDSGYIEFYNDDNRILKEYYRDWRNANEHSPSMRFSAREFKPISGNDYEITIRFEANENEKIYGMGQYQQYNLDLNGYVLELAQRNSQISIPFYIPNIGYGFLWNNAGILSNRIGCVFILSHILPHYLNSFFGAVSG